MSTSIIPSQPVTDNTSPFDSIRQVRADGSEFWSARDLMGLMGYARWEDFYKVTRRAEGAARNTGSQEGFSEITEKPENGRPRLNYHLSRYACYLVAMNGDPNMVEVAAAQAYFAIRTREAEVREEPKQLSGPELMAAALIEAQATLEATSAENRQLRRKAEEDAPKVDLAENYLATPGGARIVREVAKTLGVREGWLRSFLIEEKLLFQRQNLCGSWSYDFYADYREHFKSSETVVKHGFGNCSHYTVYVTPRGVDLIRKRLKARELVTA